MRAIDAFMPFSGQPHMDKANGCGTGSNRCECSANVLDIDKGYTTVHMMAGINTCGDLQASCVFQIGFINLQNDTRLPGCQCTIYLYKQVQDTYLNVYYPVTTRHRIPAVWIRC